MHLTTVIFAVASAIIFNYCQATPLDDYVNTPDPMFSWKRLQTYPLPTHTIYILNMTSQRWFDGTLTVSIERSIVFVLIP